MLGSIAVILLVFQRISTLHNLDTRLAIERFLDQSPGDSLNLTVPEVIRLLNVLGLIAGGCAAAATVLGYQVLVRWKPARLYLSILAAPILLAGLSAAGLAGSLVAAGVALLWLQPTRDWLDGKTPKPVTPPIPQVAPPSAPPVAPPVLNVPPPTLPPPHPGFGAVPYPGPTYPINAPLPLAVQRPRPQVVMWACILTWAFCAMAVVLLAISILVIAAAPETVLDEVRRRGELAEQGVTDTMVETATYVVGAVGIVWSLVAMVVAGFAYRGDRWAWLLLLGSTSIATLVFLVSTVGNVLMVLPLAAAAGTIALLLRPEARAWFKAR